MDDHEQPKREDRGFLTIGSLTANALNSLDQSALMASGKASDSETTGPRGLVPAGASSTGLRPGATGAARPPSIREALETLDSEQTERAAEAWLRPLATCLTAIYSADYDLVGYRRTAMIPAESISDLRRLAARLMRPSDPDAVVKHAARCLLATKSRDRGKDDTKALLAIFADELRQFPEDVVATAFRRWARREIWWPALAEIRDACQREMRWRRSLAQAVGA